jgi:hypothetical protein
MRFKPRSLLRLPVMEETGGHRKMYLFYCIVKKHKIMNVFMFILYISLVTTTTIKETKTHARRS